jgi:hypothetical protein
MLISGLLFKREGLAKVPPFAAFCLYIVRSFGMIDMKGL